MMSCQSPHLNCRPEARLSPIHNLIYTLACQRTRISMNLEKLLWLGLTLVTLSASAQLVEDPDWKETEVPPPPVFNKDKLVPIEMPKYVSLRFGVDPATLAITHDGITRYVVVVVNTSGSINTAMYEGIRCATGEVKTYARYTADGKWLSIKQPEWRSLGANHPSKHALALASQGVCTDRTPTSSVPAILNILKNPQRGP